MIGASIILCTYNGVSKLRPTILSIQNQQTDYKFELILIDNDSTDGTYEFAKALLYKSKIDFTLERCPIPGKMNAFWQGIKKAKYDYVLDCDDDNHLFSDYIQIGLEYLVNNPDVGALGGEGVLNKNVNHLGWFEKYKKSYAVGPQGESQKKYSGNFALYGAGSFFLKSVLKNLQNTGFKFLLKCREGENLSSGGDTELCNLISLSGFKLVFHHKLKFYHDVPLERISFDYLIRLKQGISGSSVLIYPYQFVFRKGFKSLFTFKLFYFLDATKAVLIYNKYYLIWGNSPKSKENKLAYMILKSISASYRKNYLNVVTHYNQLRKYFE